MEQNAFDVLEEKVRKAAEGAGAPAKAPSAGLTPEEAVEWFTAAREANKEDNGGPLPSSTAASPLRP